MIRITFNRLFLFLAKFHCGVYGELLIGAENGDYHSDRHASAKTVGVKGEEDFCWHKPEESVRPQKKSTVSYNRDFA